MRLKDWARGALVVAGLCAGHAAMAQTTIYKCTDAKGAMTVQNKPCPAGSKEDKREVGEVATQPLPSSLKTSPAPVVATPASEPTRPLPKAPPPPLHLSAKPDPTVTPPAPTGPATTIYRCTDAKGALTIQNNPCPAGSKTDKLAVQDVASMPLPGNAPATPPPAQDTAARSAPNPAPDDGQVLQAIPGMTLIEDPTLHKDDAAADALAGRSTPAKEEPSGTVTGTPPPILFQCTTYDKGTYLSEDPNPQSRCAPLKTVGLDGNAYTGAGRACEVIYDVCARVPDQRLCASWKKRLGEAEVAWRYAKPENQAKNKADYDRVQRIVTDAGCK